MRSQAPGSTSEDRAPDSKSCALGAFAPRTGRRRPRHLIIHLIIQTIQRDPSRSVWIDGAPNVSRHDPSGADQIDAEHQPTDLVHTRDAAVNCSVEGAVLARSCLGGPTSALWRSGNRAGQRHWDRRARPRCSPERQQPDRRRWPARGDRAPLACACQRSARNQTTRGLAVHRSSTADSAAHLRCCGAGRSDARSPQGAARQW